MEELAPVAGGLIRKYGSYENSSVTYEKAEQLMGAVIYCIREYEAGNDSRLLPEAKVSALAAYQAGYECVMHKAKKAVTLYNQTAVIFHSYRLRCLKDTFRKGLPEFFRHYDPRFHPQDTILTLDYPVLVNLQDLSGIDCIYEYLRCVFLEQKFLAQIPCDEVTECLREYHVLPDIRSYIGTHPGGKILCGNAAGKSHQGKQDQQSDVQINIAGIFLYDSDVDDLRHDKRNEQVEKCFEQLEQRGSHRRLFVMLKIFQKVFHVILF